MAGLVDDALKDFHRLANLVGHEQSISGIAHLWGSAFGSASKGVRHIVEHPGDIGSWMGAAESEFGLPFVWALLTGALGLDLGKAHEKLKIPSHSQIATWETHPTEITVDATRGINALGKLVAFIIGANLAFAGLSGIAKLILAQRWESAIDENLGRIGEQLGLNWAMGETLGELMQVLTTRQLEEFANVQVHPNRLDMMMVRQLARQHHVTPEQFWALLDLQGYPDDLKRLILQMDTQQLQPSELQVLWSLGKMSRADVHTYLGHVGYSDDDVSKLLSIWIDHAETQELAQFRTTLRADYLDGRISREQYRDMLAQLLVHPQRVPHMHGEGQQNYESAPDQVRIVIDQAVASADFANEYGRTTLAASELTKLFKTKHMTRDEYIARLRHTGYSQYAAQQMAETASLPPLAGKPAITTAKILAYTKGGLFTNHEAYQRLLQLGVAPKEALLLADNPDTKAGAWLPPYSVGTIKAAYMDRTIGADEARGKLHALGLTDSEAGEELQLWFYQREHGTDMTQAALARDQRFEVDYRQSIRSLFLHGGLGDWETINLLEETGLQPADASMLWAGWYSERHGHAPGALS